MISEATVAPMGTRLQNSEESKQMLIVWENLWGGGEGGGRQAGRQGEREGGREGGRGGGGESAGEREGGGGGDVPRREATERSMMRQEGTVCDREGEGRR